MAGSSSAFSHETGAHEKGAHQSGATVLEACQERLGYQFRDVGLLQSALTHASGADHRLASNERMEFLGDAILGFVVCDRLYTQYPSYLEGEMTRIKSIVVSREICTRISQRAGLAEFMILGKGMTTNPRVPDSVLAAVFESLIAAIYLDGGDGAARTFIAGHVWPEIDAAVAGDVGENHKSLLQQLAQREHGMTPSYQMVAQKGPDHSKRFKVSARIGQLEFPPAWGRSKKESEQRAAENALCELQDKSVPQGCRSKPALGDTRCNE